MLDKAEDYLIRSAECVVLGDFTDEVTVLGVAGQFAMGFFDLDLPCDIRDIIADVRNLAKADEIKWDMIAMLALDAIGLVPMIGALKYSDETAEAVTSGEKLLKESGTIYESFADMMSPEDAKRYLDFLENGSREGLTSAELAGVEKVDALLVSQKVEYEDVWDLRNAGDVLESGSKSISQVDRIKIGAWDYTPDDELYLKYKDVFDNPKYYNQETGAANWPENNGFADIPMDEVLQPGARIDRYGSDYGSFTSPEGTPYEMRAVAPGTDQRPYSVFEVVEPINVKSGSIASWFDEPGGGIQYLLPDTVDELLDAGILRRIQ